MPKMKTNSAASKRVRVTGSGTLAPRCATTSSTSPLVSVAH